MVARSAPSIPASMLLILTVLPLVGARIILDFHNCYRPRGSARGQRGATGELCVDADTAFRARVMLKLDIAFDECKKRMITPHTNVVARIDLCATLAHDNAACRHVLSIIAFHAKQLGVAVPAIARATHTFFMCHGYSSVLSPSVSSTVVVRRRRVVLCSVSSSGVAVSASVTSSAVGVSASATASSSAGASLAFGGSPVTRLMPLVRISSMVRTVSSCL